MSNKKIVIVGGVAGGMSAAARARRLDEKAEITVLERTGNVSFANCGLPYYLGGEIKSYDALILQTPESLDARFNLDVRVGHDVRSICRETKTITGVNLTDGCEFSLGYDELILSVGAKPIRPTIPGLDKDGVFTLRNLEDTAAIDEWINTKRPQNAVVVGGGYVGVEMAEQLHQRGMKIHLVDGAANILPPFDTEMAELPQAELRRNGVELYLDSFLKEIVDGEGQVGIVKAGTAAISADLVILGLGVKPDSEIAKAAGLAVGPRGGIQVSPGLQTEDPHIWAVGDAIEVLNPISKETVQIALGGPANRQGRMVANNIYGGEQVYKGTIGTAILRVFELQVGATGLKEAQLQQAGFPYESIFLHPGHHAGYYPGAETISIKLLFNPETEEIYGAQAVGKCGVDKRIDVIATAIIAEMKVSKLAELELSYSPPFGSAKDPVNMAGMMAQNLIDGLVEQAQYHEVKSMNPEKEVLLDVRSNSERARGSIAGSLHIPLDELRSRLSELPKDKTLVAYCRSGQRSYFACRILNLNGFKSKNLSGAWLTYSRSGE